MVATAHPTLSQYVTWDMPYRLASRLATCERSVIPTDNTTIKPDMVAVKNNVGYVIDPTIKYGSAAALEAIKSHLNLNPDVQLSVIPLIGNWRGRGWVDLSKERSVSWVEQHHQWLISLVHGIRIVVPLNKDGCQLLKFPYSSAFVDWETGVGPVSTFDVASQPSGVVINLLATSASAIKSTILFIPPSPKSQETLTRLENEASPDDNLVHIDDSEDSDEEDTSDVFTVHDSSESYKTPSPLSDMDFETVSMKRKKFESQEDVINPPKTHPVPDVPSQPQHPIVATPVATTPGSVGLIDTFTQALNNLVGVPPFTGQAVFNIHHTYPVYLAGKQHMIDVSTQADTPTISSSWARTFLSCPPQRSVGTMTDSPHHKCSTVPDNTAPISPPSRLTRSTSVLSQSTPYYIQSNYN
ncbi:unnamed protein product [Lepeophtheirus salmonis]|uniref:(salmon louse) hypothetical protein n=1 Tax=Lepeophtheirus salmonis TaxID=72036 RepID=A0A7R8CJ45_LEPSM|nr:unnamed protein product [Lepeophtheirus salmonis]CAF2789697.1 unnamed protein product [Lepeophtheirus salmonis]